MNPSSVWRTILATLVVTALTTACAGAGQPSPSPSRPVVESTATAWDNAVADVEPDGTRSLESALTLFAMAFGPLPGVAATTAQAGTVDSASPAVRAVYAHWDELTSEQQQAVESYLAVPDDVRTLDVPPAGTGFVAPGGSVAAVGGVFADDARPYTNLEQELLDEAARARSWAATYFGDIPELAIQIPNDPNEPYLTFFNPNSGTNGVQRCQVIVNYAHANDNRFRTRRALTLDIVHCLQSWVLGNESGAEGQVPGWAWEGPAEYIVLELWPLTESDGLAWLIYLTSPEDSLFERTYDAIGYYAQAFEAGVSLGAAFKAVLTDVDNPERFALAGTTSNEFLDKWASELSREGWGAAWDFSGPGIAYPAQAPPPRTTISVSNGSTEAFSQAAYSNQLLAMNSSADIVIVEVNGRARLGNGDVDAVIPGSASFCTTDKGCGPCPDGSPPNIEQVRLVGDSIIAVSGGTDGTNGTVSGHELEEFCQATPSPSSSPDDEFCRRWQALLDYMQQYADTEFELTQPWAAAITEKSIYMREVAPPEMLQHVGVYVRAYGIYASLPEPYNLPFSGPDAANLGTAFFTIYNYCLNQASPPPTPPPTPTPQPTPPPAASPTPTP